VHYGDSYALRFSPFPCIACIACIANTVMTLIQFTWVFFLGCWFIVAASHVWYDRFEIEDLKDQNSLELAFLDKEDLSDFLWDTFRLKCRCSLKMFTGDAQVNNDIRTKNMTLPLH
jgi:hypothetical protein